MIQITDEAKAKIQELMKLEGREDLALRVAVRGRGPGGFQYELGFVEPSDQREDDAVVEAGTFRVLVDAASKEPLQGATLDYVETLQGAGFKIDNPNPLWTDPVAQKVQEVLDAKINPGVAAHGGHVTLLDVKDGTAYIQLGGGCQGCGMVDVTLKQGIEVLIKEEVPEIQEIIDTTDHAGGRNPYYQPSKGGGPSPLS